VRKHAKLFAELFEHVLSEEEPLFMSDEATIYDVSMASPEDLLRRLSDYYDRSLSSRDSKQPLWLLLLSLRPDR
jgi:hypothetical protein